MADRCTGHCCRRFSLPMSPRELRRRADTLTDGPQVRDMVIYLGYQRTGKQHRDYPESWAKEKRHYYTCKKLRGRPVLHPRRQAAGVPQLPER